MQRRICILAVLLLALAGCTESERVVSYEQSFRCAQLPADDESLKKWFAEQPGVGDLSVIRKEKTVHVRYSRKEPPKALEHKHLLPPMEDLGYAGASPVGEWKITRKL